MRFLAYVIACVVAASATPTQGQEVTKVTFPSSAGIQLEAYLLRPQGDEARSPAIIALHGCGGPLRHDATKLNARHSAWGRILANAGYVVLFPDSFGSRGYRSLCKVRPRPVRQIDRVGDVEDAIRWLAAQPGVDPMAIGLIGWSNGGTTALHIANAPFATTLRQIIAFYPGCRSVLENVAGPPKTKLKILMGAADDWTPPEPCAALATKWNVPIVLYQGAYHSFDSPSSRQRVRRGLAFTPGNSGSAHVGTHYQARREAIAEVLSVLSKELKP